MLKKEAAKTWKLSIPIIFGEITQISLGLIDSAMVGSINFKLLAASALVNSVMNIPFVIGIGFTMSISQKVAQAHGSYDAKRVSHFLYNGFWLCLISAVLISMGLELSKDILFNLNQDEEVAHLAVPFWRIMGISVIPSLLFMGLKQFADGLEKTKTAMLLSFLALPLNVFLNWLLIFGNWGFPRMELEGAGLGTLITRVLILIAMIAVLFYHKTFKRYIAVRKNQWKVKRKTMKELLGIAVPSGLQAGMETGVFAVSGILVGTIGAVEQAAHQIALQCASFTFMVSLGLAQGNAIRIGNAFGRKDWPSIERIGKSTLVSGLIYGVICALFFAVFRNQLALIFNNEINVVLLAGTLMFYAAIFQISDASQAIAVGSLRGMNDVRYPTIIMIIAYWLIALPIGWVLAFKANMGAAGIWIGLVIGLTIVSVILNRRFFKIVNSKSINHD